MVGAPGGGRLRAWLEVLRAPLLLSPIADVLAGASVSAAFLAETDSLVYAGGAADFAPVLIESVPRVLAAALCGVLMLAGGMALNARVDLADDLRRKPDRPLPRGAVSPGHVTAVAITCLVLAAGVVLLLLPEALGVVGTMIGLIVLYHTPVKRLRLPGCVLLGSIRALDLLLGVIALRAAAAARDFGTVPSGFAPPAGDLPIHLVVVYGAYMFGASLHASTDDEAGGRAWAGLGLGLCLAALVATLPGPLAAESLGTAGLLARVLAVAVGAWAVLRILRSIRTRPRPATTGVLLSGLYLFGAAITLQPGWGAFSLLAGLGILALFTLSRLALRAYPPT